MRPEDFLSGKFKDLKFRISYPDELITTQKEVDQFAIGFAEWVMNNCDEFPKQDQNLILRVFKKEKELLNQSL